MATVYQRNSVNVLMMDVRGYGQSEGTPSEEGIKRDAKVNGILK